MKKYLLLLTIFMLFCASCAKAVKFTSIEKFDEWLSSQPDNTADTPYSVKLNISSLNGHSQIPESLGYVLNKFYEVKYVSLDLSGSSFTSIEKIAFRGCSSLTGIKIPKSVTSIGAWAFMYCYNLKNITIPDSVTDIDNEAFFECVNLTGVNLPNSITTIKPGTFISCIGLTNVIIPNSVSSIQVDAFSHCNSITSIIIPKSVTEIEMYAFINCENLISVTFEGTIPYSDLYYYEYPFYGNLREKFYETDKINGTPGTYTREKYGSVWTRK